jgi:DNA-binding response OmpR family regulator
MNAGNAEPRAGNGPEPASRPSIRIANTDSATLGLLREWLSDAGYRVFAERLEQTQAGSDEDAVLTIIDVPFCRHGATEILRRVSEQHPGAPILAMSATFFSSVRSDGACARRLGVAGVVPKPISRDKLLAAVDRLVQSTA